MKSYTISIYALKSLRKNAKCKVKNFNVWDGKNAKHLYTELMDFPEVTEWVKNIEEKTGYKHFRVIAYAGNICLRDFGYADLSSWQAEKIALEFMYMINAMQIKSEVK